MTIEKLYLHGEVLIKEFEGEIPSDAKLVEPKDGSYKLADSETTGNHHLLVAEPGMKVYEKEGRFFISFSKEGTVKCVDTKRHDTIKIPGRSTSGFQKEYDYVTEEVRNVRD